MDAEDGWKVSSSVYLSFTPSDVAFRPDGSVLSAVSPPTLSTVLILELSPVLTVTQSAG